MTDSNSEEVRGPGGLAAGCLRVQQQRGNDRTRRHHFCRYNYRGDSHHDCWNNSSCLDYNSSASHCGPTYRHRSDYHRRSCKQ
jgi:hypothetical protein